MTQPERDKYLEEMLTNPMDDDAPRSTISQPVAADPQVQELVERQTATAIEQGDVESSDRVIDSEQVVGDHVVEKQTVVIPSPDRLRAAQVVRVQRTLYYIASVITVVLLLRFILHLFGANPDNGFANLIYALSAPFHYPFRDLFWNEPDLLQNAFEISSLFAIGIYWLVAYLAVKGVAVFVRRPYVRETAISGH